MAANKQRRKDGQWIPTASDVARIHADLTVLFEREKDPIFPPGIKNLGLLESACGRPLTSHGQTEKYASLVMKLAALTHAIVKNHPFHNGNKRAALATLLTSLYKNRICLKPSVTDDQVFDFIVAVTADEFPKPKHNLSGDDVIKKIAWWIKNNSEPHRSDFGSIQVDEFIDKCVAAGVQYKLNDRHCLMNPNSSVLGRLKSISISRSTRRLSGPVAAAFVRKLGLNAANSGIDSNEFYDGARLERAEIHRYIVALRRLART